MGHCHAHLGRERECVVSPPFPRVLLASPTLSLFSSSGLALNVHSQGVTEALGPFSFDLNASGEPLLPPRRVSCLSLTEPFCPAFIVASALDISLTLHCPPPTLTVYGLKVYLAQVCVLTSFRNPEKTATIRPPKQFVLDVGPPGPYREDFVKKHRGSSMLDGKDWGGKEWTFGKVARLVSLTRLGRIERRPTDRPFRPLLYTF